MASHPYKTVIDAAPLRTALVDPETVFAELGVTPTADQTVQMEAVIGQVSGLIDSHLDRGLAQADVTDHFRWPRGDVLRLARWPVAEVLQVIESGIELAPEAWEVDETTGQLWRLVSGARACWSDSGVTTVSYVGGYDLPDELPAGIQRAAIDQIKGTHFAASRDPALRSENLPGLIASSWAVPGGDTMGANVLLPGVVAALAPWRRLSL